MGWVLLLLLSGCDDSELRIQNVDPQVQIVFPGPGDSLTRGVAVQVEGSVNDNGLADEVEVTWTLNDTPVAGCGGPVLAEALVQEGGSRCVLVPEAGSDARHARIGLDVVDRYGGRGRDEVRVLVVPSGRPRASILSPAMGAAFRQDEMIPFEGWISDPDTPVEGLTAWWESDLEGPLGDALPDAGGRILEARDLAVEGEHSLALWVTDGTVTTLDRVLFQVGPPNQAPTCAITWPRDGSSGGASDALTLQGVVGDAETPCTDLGSTWSSDGVELGAPTPAPDCSTSWSVLDLPLGGHVLQLQVTDPLGATCTTSASYQVGGGPTVVVLSPEAGQVWGLGEPLWLEGQVTDDAPCWDLEVTWLADGLPLDAPEPNGDCMVHHTTDSLTEGLHLLELEARDGDGNLGSAAVQVTLQDCLVPWYRDLDGDGHGDLYGEAVLDCEQPSGFVADALDCDDSDAAVHVDAVEVCNGVDEDCDGFVDDGFPLSLTHRDADGDGWGDPSLDRVACYDLVGWVAEGTGDETFDCDDTDPEVHPGASEVCDGLDQDCDGEVDEGFSHAWGTLWYQDLDGDGRGTGDAMATSCTPLEGFATDTLDCDDWNPAASPDLDEVCGDFTDNDCDGEVDEADASDASTWYLDGDGDGWGTEAVSVVACAAPGHAAAPGDCDDADPSVHPLAEDDCDGRDDDCNGLVDDWTLYPWATVWYRDGDGDGFGTPASTLSDCRPPDGYTRVGTDCDDGNADAWPGAPERCGDVVDNDCDGEVDEADALETTPMYRDGDGDGWGDPGSLASVCDAPGYVLAGGDCDDGDPTLSPGMAEDCDGMDNDCDGDVDEDLGFPLDTPWYRDGDGDGYGSSTATRYGCACPPGYVAEGTDCDDLHPDTWPGAPERCGDHLDNDCDGDVDEEDAVDALPWYPDLDGDGYGPDDLAWWACEAWGGATGVPGDCDDGRGDAWPGAPEACNGLDDDCDGAVDEGFPYGADTPWYRDLDGDGWGTTDGSLTACTWPEGTVATAGDCDEGRDTVNPGAPEVCGNRMDDDCDGTVDGPEAVDGALWYQDQDGDGWGDPSRATWGCSWPGLVPDGGDCDDGEPFVHPGAAEACDGVDEDCDGTVDDGFPYPWATPWYRDEDGDGFGAALAPAWGCVPPSGYVGDATDCNDGDGAVYPGAPERPNLRDDDCDDLVDE